MVVTKIATKSKNQEKANNSPSYRCAAINKNLEKIIIFFKIRMWKKITRLIFFMPQFCILSKTVV